MSPISKEDALKKIVKQEKAFSIQLNFDELIKKGIVERKKGTKYFYTILKPDSFPMEALNQSNTLSYETEITKETKTVKTYYKFPTEKQRLKALNDCKKLKARMI